MMYTAYSHMVKKLWVYAYVYEWCTCMKLCENTNDKASGVGTLIGQSGQRVQTLLFWALLGSQLFQNKVLRKHPSSKKCSILPKITPKLSKFTSLTYKRFNKMQLSLYTFS